ncbi:aminotransferase class I/II-fold pyridoxal phosphate-dependent enzyme [Clostridium thermobutyricum]|uniref:Arginine decarboxylase n=1 Tax=Clostridium thermobutyricum DSM 4928 TaxID=1121339 RepID=A0A1V4SWL6_9CLOT|nr:aminotransferase class I/II-fold pyridoxal phosphate-dependent enzyme [Clostridium thermobutyricum]OPX48616.1 arginine decarboxylase [Clostridium thermobutyricum DSM 4928]
MKNKSPQNKAPIYEALKWYKNQRIVPFDVPGHKQGRGNKQLKEFLGEDCLSVDVNSMKPLDNLCHPTSVIKEAEELAAEAFGADSAFFMVNGTTSAVQAMIMSVCKEGDKIIMPRNVHRSAINSLILIGANPIYINPGIHKRLGISLGMSLKDIEDAIKEHPDAKAVFVNNPTYYGICSDLREIVKLAHRHGMYVLVDEAHGTHFYFDKRLPVSAMEAGADMAAVSIHKTGGSLTQSSMLLMKNEKINPHYVRTIINLTQTTSGSYLLLSSLDIARKNLALHGEEIFEEVVSIAEYARSEINKIGGYYAFSKEIVNGDNVFDFDITKLTVNTLDVGLAGIEAYDILRDDYGIQIELGDIGNILSIISVGDTRYNIERLVSALSEIKRIHTKDKKGIFDHEYINPIVKKSPKEAFYAEKESILISESEGRITGEFVMCYPPGIPILAPGELITKEAIECILASKEKGSLITGPEDMDINEIQVLK